MASACLILSVVLFAPRAHGARGLLLELKKGITQKRKVSAPGRQVVEVIRLLPPSNEAYTLVVKVPDPWLERSRTTGRSNSQVMKASAPQLKVLLNSVRASGLSPQRLQPVQRAGLMAGLLRNSTHSTPKPISHYTEVLETWEILYEGGGDTLSSSLAVLAALKELSTTGYLASYRTADTSAGTAFAVLIKGKTEAGLDWAWPVEASGKQWALLPLHLKARPKGKLRLADLRYWKLDKVLSRGWKPKGPAGERPPEAKPDPDEDRGPGKKAPPPRLAPPPRRKAAGRLDICARAEAMGLQCVKRGGATDIMYYVISAALGVGLLIALISTLIVRSRRKATMRQRQQERRRRGF